MLKLKSVNFEQQEFGTHTLAQSHAGQLEWVIGRYATCDLVLSAQEVSRVHARILYQDDTYYFMDDGSTSGSSLNGEILKANEKRAIRIGDLLQIGETYLHVEELEPPSQVVSEALDAPTLSSHQWNEGDLSLRCCRIIDETPAVKTFCFTADPPLLFNYKPGQFINLEFEINGKPVLRPYSISSSPTRPHHIAVTVKREPRPADSPDIAPGLVSNWLHDHLKVGDRIKLAGSPMGQFTCLPDLPSKILMISAGSGITPLMSMVRWVHDTLVNCDIVFLHSARSPEEIIFRDELAAMSAQMPNFHLAITTTQPGRHAWMGLTGRVSQPLLHLVAPDLLERSVYVCGPNGFVQTVKSLLEKIDFPMQQYKQESFGGKQAISPAPAEAVVPNLPASAKVPPLPPRNGASAAPTKLAVSIAQVAIPSGNGTSNGTSNGKGSPGAVKAAPAVKFAKSDREVLADGNSSVLELAEQEGVSIRSACRVGSCGACKVVARQGRVQYSGEPMALTAADQQAGYILCCIARPVDRLVVEA